VSLSSQDEQCQPDCLSVYFLTPNLLQPYLTLCVVHTWFLWWFFWNIATWWCSAALLQPQLWLWLLDLHSGYWVMQHCRIITTDQSRYFTQQWVPNLYFFILPGFLQLIPFARHATVGLFACGHNIVGKVWNVLSSLPCAASIPRRICVWLSWSLPPLLCWVLSTDTIDRCGWETAS